MGVHEDALDVLANATPGNRVMCSTGANRTSQEGGGVKNGHFTHALLSAMMTAPGDVRGDFTRWLSDERLFLHTRKHLTQRWGQRPHARRLTGDFPVVRDHRPVYGDSAIVEMDWIGSRLCVVVRHQERYGLPTLVRAEALNHHGRTLRTIRHPITPTNDDSMHESRFRLPLRCLISDPVSLRHIRTHGMAPISWRVSIMDGRHRVLDEAREEVRYTPRISRRLPRLG